MREPRSVSVAPLGRDGPVHTPWRPNGIAGQRHSLPRCKALRTPTAISRTVHALGHLPSRAGCERADRVRIHGTAAQPGPPAIQDEGREAAIPRHQLPLKRARAEHPFLRGARGTRPSAEISAISRVGARSPRPSPSLSVVPSVHVAWLAEWSRDGMTGLQVVAGPGARRCSGTNGQAAADEIAP